MTTEAFIQPFQKFIERRIVRIERMRIGEGKGRFWQQRINAPIRAVLEEKRAMHSLNQVAVYVPVSAARQALRRLSTASVATCQKVANPANPATHLPTGSITSVD